MKIIEELELEVANEIHTGSCRMIVVDQPVSQLEELADSLYLLTVDGRKRYCFIARATVEENGKSYHRINIYILEKVEGSLLGKTVSL